MKRSDELEFARLELARLETMREDRDAPLDTGMFGVCGMVAVYGVGCLLAGAIIVVSGIRATWLAALIVSMALLAYAGAAVLRGKRSE